MAKARLVWVGMSAGQVGDAAYAWWQGVEQKLEPALQRVGQDMRAYAQMNHPWTNRTGRAEAELNYNVSREGNAIVLTVYQGAPYGIWLEVRWGGRWGILPETMTANYGRVMAAISAAMG